MDRAALIGRLEQAANMKVGLGSVRHVERDDLLAAAATLRQTDNLVTALVALKDVANNAGIGWAERDQAEIAIAATA